MRLTCGGTVRTATGRTAQHLLGDGSEHQVLEATGAMCSHDDQVGGPRAGAIENAAVRLTHVDDGVDVNPCASRRLEVRRDLAP